MTTLRYRNYRRALTWIGMLDAGRADPDAVETLRQSAEDLLLTRDATIEAEELIATASAALRELTENGAISRALADAVLEALRASGPGSATPAAGVALS